VSRWDRIGSHVIHSRTAPGPANGSGPVLVLVHGLVISSLYMVPTAERLAPNFRLLAPDLPGFGLSSKPDRTFSIPDLADVLAQWLRALGLDRVVLIGNSLGCQIIADFATRHAGSIQATVLAGPTMDSRARTAPQQIGRWLVDWLQERPSLAAAHLRDYREAGLRRAWQTFRYALADPVERKLASLDGADAGAPRLTRPHRPTTLGPAGGGRDPRRALPRNSRRSARRQLHLRAGVRRDDPRVLG